MDDDFHWRDTAREIKFFWFDISIILLLPVLILLILLRFPALPTTLFVLALLYYLIAGLVLRMPVMKSLKILLWKVAPRRRPSRNPLYINRPYDIQGLSSWRIQDADHRSNKT